MLTGVIISLSLANTASASAIPKPSNNLGLVGYWSMNDAAGSKATDQSGQGNTGTLTNFALSGSTSNWVTGKVGSGLNFDGTNDRINVGLPSSLNFSGTMTVSAWVKDNNATGVHAIFTNYNGSGNMQYAFEFNRTADKLSWWNSTTAQDALSTGTITDTNWHHVVAVRSGSTGNWTITFYIDGVDAGATTGITNNPGTYDGAVGVGALASYDANYWNGSLDDVRVYNRALSSTEVTTLYNNSVRRTVNKAPSTTGLVGYWSLNDGAGSKATDQSGQGNTGTVSGATWMTGKVGTALNFDGVNDYVDVSDTPFDFSDSFSVSTWVKPADSSSLETVAWKTNSFGIGYGHTGVGGCVDANELFFAVFDGSSWYVACWNATTPTTAYTHVVGVFSNSGDTVKIYINGTEVNSTAITTTPNNSALNLRIGNYDSDPDGGYFGGYVDDVRIYNRALSATEVTALYNGSKITKVNYSQNSKLTDGLVGLWSFNGPDLTTTTATDGSTNDNHGTLTNGPTPTIGKIGQALNFDGTDDYVDAGDITALESSGSYFTISTWVKVVSGAVSRIIVAKKDNASLGYYFFISAAGKLNIFFGGGSFQADATSVASINDGNWHHVVAVRNADTATLYIDGIQDGTNTAGGTIGDLSNTIGFKIGRSDHSAGPYYFPGSIDDVRIYNRVLTAAEVLSLYNQGR